MPAKRSTLQKNEGGEAETAVGRTTVTKDYKEGASSIWVTSAMELFGPLVELVKIEGSFTTQFVVNAAPQTIQLGSQSPCVNVEKVFNNQLIVTPISVRSAGCENDVVVFGTCGPSGLRGLAARIKQPGLAGQDSRRVDFAALKAELAALEFMGIDTTAGGQGDGAKKAAKEKGAGGFKTEKQLEAEETEERADACFWEGMHHEKLDDPVKLFYCPIIDSRAECGLGARLAYTEAARLFGRCIDLNNTHLPYYAKRCAALCKLRMFSRALPDANNYESLRPDSPTGPCMKGVVYDGLNQYNLSIAYLEKALERAEIIPYDGSRVWSNGTLTAETLKHAIDRRSKVADRARVANQHGVKWRTLGEYGRAVPCLLEAAQLQKDCVGDMHLHYAICLNNLGSCMEAMGNYDEAMRHYKESLKVSEAASPGTLRVMVCSARHLPHVMKAGTLQDGEWVEDGESCDTYVEVEKLETEDTSRRGTGVCTKVIRNNYQPTWNQVLGIKAPRGDRSVVVRLIGRNPQRIAFLDAAAEKRQLIKEPLDKAKKLDIHLKELQARIKRLEEIGRAKAKELEKVQKDFKRELKGVEPLAALIEQLQHEEQHLIRRSQGLEDRVIGQFVYDVKSLSSTLEGQASSSIKKWIETPDLDGNGVRGEDYGVTAVQLEVTWSPDCSEYATRLCNIGNLYRIFGDRMSARTVGVCNEYKKLEINYNLAESHLEASRTVMERAKSIAPPKTMTDLQAERAKQRGEVHDSSKDVVKVDGKESEEYCVVLENLSLLHHARGLGITFPKGTPESVKAQAEGQRQKSNRTAVALLEECMVLRARLMGAESDEYLRLVRILAEFHAETKVSRNDSLEPWEKLDLNYPDALPVQEQALQLSKKLHGDKSAQASADLEKLSQLHLRLGKAGVRKGSHGSWVIDPAESWHWDMVSQVARKVCKSSITTHDHTGREAKLLQSHAESILKERTRILNPPPITDYSDPKDEDPLLKKAKAEAERKTKTRGAIGDIKMSRAVASKLRAPDTELVRMDVQRWPKNGLHTATS